MTKTGAIARPPIEDRAEGFMDWVQTHTREVLIGVVVAALAVGGWALYRSTEATKEIQGERALYEAQRSYMSGNLPLAQSDLQKVSARFGGTPAGVQATMLMAQVMYDQKKYAEGIAALQKAEGSGGAKVFRSSIHALEATGYEEQGKFREAAEQYKKAADATSLNGEKQVLLGNAARSYQLAGDKATAIQMWSDLSKDPSGSVAGEARVRLGELTAEADRS